VYFPPGSETVVDVVPVVNVMDVVGKSAHPTNVLKRNRFSWMYSLALHVMVWPRLKLGELKIGVCKAVPPTVVWLAELSTNNLDDLREGGCLASRVAAVS